MTAVRPSRARALASGPASSARPEVSCAASSSASCLRVCVVAADERILVRRLIRAEARGGERVQARDDRRVELGLDSLGERDGFRGRKDAVLREAELGRDGEHRRRADRPSQLAGRVERRLGVDGEDDEVGVVARLGVRRPRAVELEPPPPPRAPRHASRRRPRAPTREGVWRAPCRTARCRRRSLRARRLQDDLGEAALGCRGRA